MSNSEVDTSMKRGRNQSGSKRTLKTLTSAHSSKMLKKRSHSSGRGMTNGGKTRGRSRSLGRNSDVNKRPRKSVHSRAQPIDDQVVGRRNLSKIVKKSRRAGRRSFTDEDEEWKRISGGEIVIEEESEEEEENTKYGNTLMNRFTKKALMGIGNVAVLPVKAGERLIKAQNTVLKKGFETINLPLKTFRGHVQNSETGNDIISDLMDQARDSRGADSDNEEAEDDAENRRLNELDDSEGEGETEEVEEVEEEGEREDSDNNDLDREIYRYQNSTNKNKGERLKRYFSNIRPLPPTSPEFVLQSGEDSDFFHTPIGKEDISNLSSQPSSASSSNTNNKEGSLDDKSYDLRRTVLDNKPEGTPVSPILSSLLSERMNLLEKQFGEQGVTLRQEYE